MISQAELILGVITLWFLVLSQFFRDGMGPFNKCLQQTETDGESFKLLLLLNTTYIITTPLPTLSNNWLV